MKWIWPFSWYFQLLEARQRIAVQGAMIEHLSATNARLQAEVISAGIAMNGITNAYLSALHSESGRQFRPQIFE